MASPEFRANGKKSPPSPELMTTTLSINSTENEKEKIEHRDTVDTNRNQQESREELILKYGPLVRFIAQKIRSRLPLHVDLEDLVSAGTLGLIDAIDKFDATKGANLNTYAPSRIRGAILDSLRETDWLGRTQRVNIKKLTETIDKLRQELERTPIPEEIMAELAISEKKYHKLERDLVLATQSSLDDSTHQLDRKPIEEPKSHQDVEHEVLDKEVMTIMMESLDQLTLIEQEVLIKYFFEEKTLREIGLEIGKAESRASQIKNSALAKLNSIMIAKGIGNIYTHIRKSN